MSAASPSHEADKCRTSCEGSRALLAFVVHNNYNLTSTLLSRRHILSEILSPHNNNKSSAFNQSLVLKKSCLSVFLTYLCLLLLSLFNMFSRKSISALRRCAQRPVLSVTPVQHLAGAARHGRSFSGWSTKNPEEMFKLTSQALIHDISLHQMETVKTVVPWFLKNMPVSSV